MTNFHENVRFIFDRIDSIFDPNALSKIPPNLIDPIDDSGQI